jgi:hypothetical protein
VRSAAALAMVQNVKRAANAHGSASFVPIGASFAVREMAIPGTVAKRTICSAGTRAPGTGTCRISVVTGAEQQA